MKKSTILQLVAIWLVGLMLLLIAAAPRAEVFTAADFDHATADVLDVDKIRPNNDGSILLFVRGDIPTGCSYSIPDHFYIPAAKADAAWYQILDG